MKSMAAAVPEAASDWQNSRDKILINFVFKTDPSESICQSIKKYQNIVL